LGSTEKALKFRCALLGASITAERMGVDSDLFREFEVRAMRWAERLIGPPLCARCQRQVELAVTRIDHATQELIVEVRCHGETEVSRLSCGDLANSEVHMIPAFARVIEGDKADAS
jgi:hypothetical protein